MSFSVQEVAQLLKQAIDLYNQNKMKECFSLYERALEINRENWICLNNYAIRLIAHFQNTQDKEHLNKALNLLELALKIEPDLTFNLAVHHCIKGDKHQTNQNLMRAFNKYSYPSPEEFENIFNPNNHRNTEWYQYIIEELKRHDSLPF